MANVEEISVLAVVEAQDKATSILSSIFGSITGLVDAYKRFGEASALSGQVFSDSMMGLMTVEERAATAALRLQDAETMASEASMAMREAQVELGAAVEREGFASDAAAAAQDRLRVATLANTIASNGLKDAQRDNAAAQEELNAKQALGKETLAATSSAMIGVGAVTAVAAGASVDLAAKFQTQTQTLVAGAGVSKDQIDGVRKNILQMAQDTGTSTSALTEGFFQVNSRLGDVAKSTQVVQDAAELAKVHMADMATVGKALADAMNSYSASGLSASQASNILGTAVEEGGMSFQDLSSSLSQVAPIAASMKIPLQDVTAALATMTTQGMSTQQASQDLRHAIEKLNSPTAGMITTWNQFGLTAAKVQTTLAGPGGLQKAMEMIDTAIKSKMGPSGQIVIDTFKQSTDAANAMNMMLQKMDPSAKQLATELQGGSISMKDYTKGAKELSGASADQALQFQALFNKANGFNDALKAGKPGFADYNDALKSAYGDQTSMQAALMLSGDHAEKWTKITKDSTAAMGDANGQVKGWSDVQGTLSQKMAEGKQALESAAITLGTALIPAVTQIVEDITPWIEKMGKLLEHHQTFVKVLVAVGLALGVLGAAIKVITMVTEAWEAIQVVLDAELWANPIGVIILAIIAAIAAITAIVAAVIYAYNHFKWFHDLVNTVWNGLKTGAMAVWHALEAAFNGIVTAAEAVGHFFVSLWNTVSGATKTAWDAVSGFIKKAWDAISSTVTSAAKAVWGFISGVWDSIVNTTTSVWDGIKKFFEKWWPLLLVIFAFPIAVIMSIWNHFHTEIESVAKTVWNGISGFFKMIWDGLVTGFNWVVGVLKDIWDGLSTAASWTWTQIKNYIVKPIEEVWNWLTQKWDALMNWIGGVWDGIANKASAAWQTIKRYIIQPISEFLDWIGGNISRVWDSFSNTFNGLMNWLGGIGSWFEGVGEDIVNGIINGVSHAGSWLMDKMKNLANDALGAAKSFLGIGSPSRLFADEIGQWIPHGVAQGVEKHASVAIQAVQNMAGSLPQAIGVNGAVNLGVNGLNAAGTVTATGLGLTAGVGMSKGGGDVHVHMDMRDAIVSGDKGMTDLASRIGNVLATQILPQAGVRLHTF